jgi:hypothetical protein
MRRRSRRGILATPSSLIPYIPSSEMPVYERIKKDVQRMAGEALVFGLLPQNHAQWLYSRYEHDSAKPAHSGKPTGCKKVAVWHQ